MGKSRLAKLTAVFAACALSQPVFAAHYACSKTLDQVVERGDGYLMIRFNGAAMVSAAICSLTSGINVTTKYYGVTYTWTITPDMCKSYQAMFLTAQAAGRSIAFAWDLSGPPTCTASTWTNPFDSLMAPYPYEFAVVN